jgi:c(7)-type cytochrome triheme protein
MVRKLVVLAIVLAASSAAAVPFVNPNDRHFDHDRHTGAVAKAGRPAATCGLCHDATPQGEPKLKGKLEHQRCFEACHDHKMGVDCGTLSAGGASGPTKLVCLVCHAVILSKCTPPGLVPQSLAPSFTAHFVHATKGHADPELERACARCHRAEARGSAQPGGSSHSACASCHGPVAKPAMTECGSCHVSGKVKAPHKYDPYGVANFDHGAHTATAKNGKCFACHNRAAGEKMRPTMLGCQVMCHDGQKSFAATGTTCTKCHRAPDPPIPARSDLAFSHAEHAKRNVKVDNCTDCHGVDAEGLVAPPGRGKDHRSCSAKGCHENEFLSRGPKICGVCHDSVSPWVKSVARVRERPTTEYYQSIDHVKHLRAGGTVNATCDNCHGDKFAGGKRPTGHKACAQCHNKQQRPSMNECAACHLRSAPAHAQAGPWSVRATFKHETHGTDKRNGRQTACVDCHDTIATAKDLASVQMPKMQRCDTCHDGKTAFKSTGFGCARCHARVAAK